MPRPHPAQWQVKREAARFNVLDCGRRWGKTTFAISELVPDMLAGHPVAWFAPTYKMLAEVWREFRRVLRPVTKEVNKQERRITLITGGFIDFWSLDREGAVRGRKYKKVVIDEAAMVPHLQAAWQEVIRPTLTDYRGGAWILSTPRGLNFFHLLFTWGQDETKPDWRSWHLPTSTNPYIDPREIEAAREELPEAVFAQEYLAEFLQGEGAVFRRVKECLLKVVPSLEEHKDHRIVLGGDWGRKNDFTALSVGCADCKVELALVRFNQISWSLQRMRLKTTLSEWGVEDALLESNSIGSPNLEALQEEGLPVRGFETTAKTKAPLIQSLALAFEQLEWRWLDEPVATSELIAYECKTNAHTGHVSYSAPTGGHDDTVIARALMRRMALSPRRAESGTGVSLW